MISRLSDLLRLALESAGAQEVPLRQEMDFLRRYLEIQQIRFQDQLARDASTCPTSCSMRACRA